MAFKRRLYIYTIIQMQNIKTLLEYRVDFLLMFLLSLISQSCFYFFLEILYSNVESIAGWQKWQIYLLYGLLLFSEGSVNFFCQGVWKIKKLVNTGAFDVFLIRPLPVGLQIITAHFDADGLNKMIMAAVICTAAMNHLNIVWTAEKIIVFLLTLFEGCILRSAIIYLGSSISFWTESSKNNVNDLFHQVSCFAQYPLLIYPGVLQLLLKYVLPYAYMSYYPVRFLMNDMSGLQILIPLTLFVLFFLVLSGLILKLGLKRYESAG